MNLFSFQNLHQLFFSAEYYYYVDFICCYVELTIDFLGVSPA
jgi:hypothetical protein